MGRSRLSGALWARLPHSGKLIFLSLFLMSLTAVLAGPLEAQECDLAALPGASQEAAPTTTFLPNGNVGEILVKWPNPAKVRVFEISQPISDAADKDKKWKQITEATVATVRPTPDKLFQARGFTPTNSTSIRFIVPEQSDSFWPLRHFAVRLCGQDKDAAKAGWAQFSVRVSDPWLARKISVLVLALLYIAFVTAIYKKNSDPHPLAAKYPSYQAPKQYRWSSYLNPVVLTAGVFHQSSIQKLQVLLFTFVVGGMVLSLVLTAGLLPEFSPTVAMLLGISAVGAAIAQKAATNAERLQFENWAWLVKKKAVPINREVTPRWADLVMTGRELDVYKLQTLLFSGVVAIALLATGEEQLGTFTVPETLLGILGLSQVVYIAGTLVRPPSVSDLDKALTELRALESKAQTVVAHNTDIDSDGNVPKTLALPTLLPSVDDRKKNAPKVLAQYKKKADEVEIMLESTLETEVPRARLNPELH